MRKKEFLKDSLMSFFIIVTCVNISSFILGCLFDPTRTFGYEAFLSPIIYGVFGSLPNIVMYSKKELSVKAILVRKAIQLILIEAILLLIAFGSFNKSSYDHDLIFSFCLTVFIIFIIVHVISWIIDSKTAKLMTLDLQSFQKRLEP